MKIGITCYPTVGGSGVIATELGKALARNGHEVHFIASSIPYRLDEAQDGIYFHEVQVNSYAVFQYPPYDLALASKMADVIKQEKLDVLHVHYAVPHAVSAFLASEMTAHPVRIVTTLHGTDITVLGYDPSLSDIIRFGIERSDEVTAVSNDLIRQTNELLDITKPITPVYNFVDDSVYYKRQDSGLKKSLSIPDEVPVMTHVSNFRKVKRVEDVVKTFMRVRQEMDVRLLLIGDGPELPVIRAMVKQEGLEPWVHITGTQKRVADLLSISDVKLLLSSKESFGLVLLEAMACGVPVIGSSAGGIPEVIEEGVTGYVVPVGDTEAAASRALHMLANPELRKKMGEEAVKRTAVAFNKQAIVDDYVRVYQKACSR
ncbi:N-acetyl-alpha-D-glucosaminyl L-malate synthase BshA [Alkalicoccus luteus]|uniref:N-acetyl-alpha-D-glucosaminyl L-malate synthase BshA n=1 Tax=Alkalicoccus luteus TaxID=1237094 RepID=UPI0040331FBB